MHIRYSSTSSILMCHKMHLFVTFDQKLSCINHVGFFTVGQLVIYNFLLLNKARTAKTESFYLQTQVPPNKISEEIMVPNK